MSLQVWLPLNGDLHNQGLTEISIVNNSTTINNNGKIGKCLHFSNTEYITMTPGFLPETGKEFSCCYWVKELSNNTVTNFRVVYECGQFIVGQYGNKFNVWQTNSGIDIAAVIDSTMWVHCCVTVDASGLCKIYINGQYQAQKTISTYPNSGTTTIGRRTINGTNANNDFLINDFRIYNHCLSTKEVEEISKGLILHYKLDNNGFGNENYWGNGKPLRDGSGSGELITMFARTNSAYASVPTFIPNQYIETKFLSTRTPVEDGGIQFQKLQRYSETVNSMCPILEHLKTGEHFTISYELYITSPMKVKFHLSKKLDGTSTKVQPNPDSIQISTLNTWTKISQSIEIPSSFDESNLTTESRLGMYISIDEILGTTSSGEVTIRIRNIKFEKGQVATDWTPARADFGHINDNVIYDSSGYGNNGNIVGDLTTIMQGPRYNYAAHLESSSPTTNNNTGLSYVQTPLQISAPTQMTVCWWANPENGYNNSVGHGAWCTSANNEAPLDYNSTAFHHRDNKFDICLNSASTTSLSLAFSNYTKNEWHYYSVVYDGKDAILYKDGVETNRSSISSTIAPLKSFTNLYIGFSKAGGVWRKTLGAYSDFRIYSTALTAEQIKELYNTSATIDKNGNIYAREQIENFGDINITKIGQLQSNKIVDDNTITIANFKKSDKSINGNTIYEY